MGGGPKSKMAWSLNRGSSSLYPGSLSEKPWGVTDPRLRPWQCGLRIPNTDAPGGGAPEEICAPQGFLVREERPQERIPGVGSLGLSTLTGSGVPGSGPDPLGSAGPGVSP